MKFAFNLPLRFKIDISKKNKIKSKILLKKLFNKYFSSKLLLKKQGFSGFPNEMSSYLGNQNNYKILQELKLNNLKKKLKKFDRKEMWKIINLEFFIRNNHYKMD